MARSHLIGLTGLSMFVLALGACSATSNGNGFGGGDAGSSGSTISGGNGAGGDVIGGTGGDGTIPSTGPGGEVCAGTLSDAKQRPLDMYIMLDQSGSMDGNRWTSVTNALKNFIAQPSVSGVGVGIQFFPTLPPGVDPSCQQMTVPFCQKDADCGACGPCELMFGFGTCKGVDNADSCSAADYAAPAVEIAPLPGVAAAIKASIDAHGPTGGTPTAPALQGAISHAKEWATAHPGHSTIVVLASDGEPQECSPTDIASIAAIAASGLSGTPSIKTFVIGVGSSVAALNQLAVAGGTDAAFFVDDGSNVNQAFLDAMNAIRGSALSCSYFIPKPDDGKEVDFGRVNVLYTPQGAEPTYINKVGGAADCVAAGNGWYYDDPVNPTGIIVCPATCETFQGDTTGRVEVQSGCVTKIQ